VTEARARFAVLGLGNELFTDEGVGVEAARAVSELGLPDVDALDGGTLGLALLPEIEGRTGLLVLDAMAAPGRESGEVVVLGADELVRPRLLLMSAHQVGIAETLGAATLMGVRPPLLAAVGMVPFSLDTGYGITPAARERLPEMVDSAVEILEGWLAAERIDA
jgi:hydrogenase maturation protease